MKEMMVTRCLTARRLGVRCLDREIVVNRVNNMNELMNKDGVMGPVIRYIYKGINTLKQTRRDSNAYNPCWCTFPRLCKLKC